MPIIQPATYTECGCCGHRKQVAGELYGCDMCQRHIPYDADERYEIVVFGEREAKHYIFHQLACAYAWLATFPLPDDFRFLTLPYLTSPEQVRWFTELLKVETLTKLPVDATKRMAPRKARAVQQAKHRAHRTSREAR